MNFNEKRIRILKAAASVFARKGFHHARITDIARQAQVADGTIYLYFKNKNDLLISLFDEEMSAILKRLKTALAPLTTVEAKLSRFIEFHLSIIDENRELAEVLQIELRQSRKFMKQYARTRIQDYLNVIAGILEEGQQQGEVKKSVIPGLAKRILFGALDEISSYWVLTKNRKYSRDEAIRMIKEIFLNGIGADTNIVG